MIALHNGSSHFQLNWAIFFLFSRFIYWFLSQQCQTIVKKLETEVKIFCTFYFIAQMNVMICFIKFLLSITRELYLHANYQGAKKGLGPSSLLAKVLELILCGFGCEPCMAIQFRLSDI